jgi:hypothetical protein
MCYSESYNIHFVPTVEAIAVPGNPAVDPAVEAVNLATTNLRITSDLAVVAQSGPFSSKSSGIRMPQ